MSDHLTTPPMSLDTARKVIRAHDDSAFAHAAGLVLARLEEVEKNIALAGTRFGRSPEHDYGTGWTEALDYALHGYRP